MPVWDLLATVWGAWGLYVLKNRDRVIAFFRDSSKFTPAEQDLYRPGFKGATATELLILVPIGAALMFSVLPIVVANVPSIGALANPKEATQRFAFYVVAGMLSNEFPFARLTDRLRQKLEGAIDKEPPALPVLPARSDALDQARAAGKGAK